MERTKEQIKNDILKFAEEHDLIILREDFDRFLRTCHEWQGRCACDLKRGQCPCEKSLKEIEEEGQCCCRLFAKRRWNRENALKWAVGMLERSYSKKHIIKELKIDKDLTPEDVEWVKLKIEELKKKKEKKLSAF